MNLEHHLIQKIKNVVKDYYSHFKAKIIGSQAEEAVLGKDKIIL